MYLDNISSLEFIQQNRAPAHRMVVVRLNLLLSNGLPMQRGAALEGGLRGQGAIAPLKILELGKIFELVLSKDVSVYTPLIHENLKKKMTVFADFVNHNKNKTRFLNWDTFRSQETLKKMKPFWIQIPIVTFEKWRQQTPETNLGWSIPAQQ